MAKQLRDDIDLLREMQRILNDDDAGTTRRNGEAVHQALRDLLTQRLERGAARGKAARQFARQRPLIAHIDKVLTSYAPGLFTCYDHPALPATTNAIEGFNGELKHHIRACTGRASTAGGIAQTQAELLAPAARLYRQHTRAELHAKLAATNAHRYHEARAVQRLLRAPSHRYRSIQRNPKPYLKALSNQALQRL